MGERGVAVIMAMWLLAVLAIIGTTFVFMMRLEPIIARTHRDDMSLNNPLADNSPWKNLLDGLSVSAAVAQNIINYQVGDYGPFETLDELACVNGISEGGYSVYFRKAKVHHKNFPANPTTRLPINVNTASEEALRAALGELTGSTYAILKVTNTNINRVVAAILAYRAGEDGVERTADDNPFDGVDSYVGDDNDQLDTDDSHPFNIQDVDLDPDGGSFGSARDEFNEFINYVRKWGYPNITAVRIVEKSITYDYVRDNIKDNFDVGVDYDNYDSNTDVDGNQDNHYQCTNCKAVVASTTTTCPVCGEITPKEIKYEIDRDGTYEPGVCPDHNVPATEPPCPETPCPFSGKVMSIDSTLCPICGASVAPTAYDPLDFSADPETYTTNFSFNNSPTGPPQSHNNQFFEIISTGRYVSPSGQETLKRIRIIINRGKATPAIEGKIWYYKEEPED